MSEDKDDGLVDGVDIDDEEDEELLDFLKFDAPVVEYCKPRVNDYLCRVAANNSGIVKNKAALFNIRTQNKKMPESKVERSSVELKRLELCIKEIKRLRLERMNQKLNTGLPEVKLPSKVMQNQPNNALVSKVPLLRKSFLEKIKLFQFNNSNNNT